MKNRTHVVISVAIAASAVVFAACGGSDDPSESGSPSSANTFVLSEFTVNPPTNALQAGNVTLTADNVGGELHELVIVRADGVSALPMKSDGSVDEAKIKDSDTIVEFSDVAAASSKTETFNLTSGTYVAFCNLIDEMEGSGSSMDHGSGHVHFGEGMYATFAVT